MATTGVCGSTGTISLGGEITKWNLDLLCEAVEAVSMASSGAKEYIACLKSATGSFDSLTSVGGAGASAGVVFTNDKGSWTMDIIITSVVTTVDVNSVVTFTYNFESNGAIT